MIAIVILFPKFVWRLHLLAMKLIIFILFLVICVGFYNYVSSFGFSFQYLGLRTQLEENILVVKDVVFLDSVWSLKEFEAVKINRNLDAINKVVKHTFIEMKPNVFGFPLKKLEELTKKSKLKLISWKGLGVRSTRYCQMKPRKHMKSLKHTSEVL